MSKTMRFNGMRMKQTLRAFEVELQATRIIADFSPMVFSDNYSF